jgi:hypothetical protein
MAVRWFEKGNWFTRRREGAEKKHDCRAAALNRHVQHAAPLVEALRATGSQPLRASA